MEQTIPHRMVLELLLLPVLVAKLLRLGGEEEPGVILLLLHCKSNLRNSNHRNNSNITGVPAPVHSLVPLLHHIPVMALVSVPVVVGVEQVVAVVVLPPIAVSRVDGGVILHLLPRPLL